MDLLDLGPAARTMTGLVLAAPDERLADPTPCEGLTVADLFDHVGGLSFAFTAAARKQRLPHAGPRTDGSQLEDGWRERIAAQLDQLAEAWTHADAYDGITQAGPVDLPGAVAAQVALNELVIHGWDLARGLDVPYEPDAAAVEACLAFVRGFEAPEGGPADEGVLYGPPVAVADDAPPFAQLLGLTGRRPAGSFAV